MFEWEVETARSAVDQLTNLLVEAVLLVPHTPMVLSRYVDQFQDFSKSQICGAVPTIQKLRNSFALDPISLEYI